MLPIVILVGAVLLIVWYENKKKGSSDGGSIQATFPISSSPTGGPPPPPSGGTPTPGGTLPPATTATALVWRRVGRHGHQYVTIQPGQRFRLVMTVQTLRSAAAQYKLPYNQGGLFLLVQHYLPVKADQITVWGENEPLPADWPRPISVDPVNGDPFGSYAYRVEGVATASAGFGSFSSLAAGGWQAWALST